MTITEQDPQGSVAPVPNSPKKGDSVRTFRVPDADWVSYDAAARARKETASDALRRHVRNQARAYEREQRNQESDGPGS